MRIVKSVFIVFMMLMIAGNAFADRLDQMISPVTNPINFEDPRINSELRFIFIHHEFDDKFVTQGGNLRWYALQFRYAFNDEWAFIATKDGYIDFNPDGLPDDDGWANVTPGVKWNFWKDAEAGQIASATLRYEMPIGNSSVFQGEGDGIIQPTVTFASALGDNWNFMGDLGFRIPIDSDDSSFWDMDAHISYMFDLGDGMAFYPLLEANFFYVMNAGDRLPIADEGLDAINFGSSLADDKAIVLGSVGGRLRINEDWDLGVAGTWPMTNGSGSYLYDWRFIADVIWSF